MTHIWWYATRSAGFVAWIMLTFSVAWGLLISTKLVRGRGRGPWLLGTHRMLSAAATVFTAIHVIAILADSYVRFSFLDTLIPLRTSWHPIAVAWGIVGLWLILAVEISSLLRKYLPKRLWKAIHLSSFLLFVSATVHGFMAGTDTRTMAISGVAFVVALPLLFLMIYRLLLWHDKKNEVPVSRIPVGLRRAQ